MVTSVLDVEVYFGRNNPKTKIKNASTPLHNHYVTVMQIKTIANVFSATILFTAIFLNNDHRLGVDDVSIRALRIHKGARIASVPRYASIWETPT